MANRIELQTFLETLLGSRNVYYQSPGNNGMAYPAIKYSKSNIQTTYASDKKYSKMTRYEIIVISRLPDNPVIEKILDLPYSSFDRNYKADGLNHDVITLYW